MSESGNANAPTGKPHPDLTSYQLVIGICIALGVAAACFVCGFFLGSWRSSLGTQRPVRENQTQTVAEGRPPGKAAGHKERPSAHRAAREGTQTYPRPPRVELPAAKPPTDETPSAEGGKTTEPGSPAETKHPSPATPPSQVTPAEVGAKPAADATASAGVAATTATASADSLAAMDKAPPLPDSAPVPVSPSEPAAPAATSPPPSAVSEPVPLPSPPKAPETPAVQGGFGVQIASFAGANRQQAAEAYVKRLASSDSALTILLLPSEDGKYVRAVVGPYPDRQTAETLCRELRKRAEFKECFVKALP